MQLKFRSKSNKKNDRFVSINCFFFVEDDFKTFNDQYLACLILDLQVKSINGNEANILVPKDWREQFLREQEQQYSRSEILESERE